MDPGLFRYDEPYTYGRPRRRTNYFAWTVAILLLTGLAIAAWIGSFYIIGQPERPESYRILQKLHKVDPPKRFELTAAPAGEFLTAQQVFERYSAMGAAELAKVNGELVRNYIRIFNRLRGLVPYVIGRYTIMEARETGTERRFHFRDGRPNQRGRARRTSHGTCLSRRSASRAAHETSAHRWFGS